MKTPLLLLAALAAAAGLGAQSENSRSSYSITADFTYTSKYVFRGVQLARDSLQASAEVAVGAPRHGEFYGNLWTNQPFDRGEDDEIDFRVGYRRQVAKGLSLEALATYYGYPRAGTGATKHTVEGGVGATFDARGFSPSVYYYYDFNLKASTVEGAIGYGIPLPAIGTSLDVSVFAGTSQADDAKPESGVTVKESYNYYGASLEVPYQLSQNTKFRVGAHWATNEKYIAGTPRDRFWVDVGFTVAF